MPFQRTVTVKGGTDIGVQNGLLTLVPGPDITNYTMRFAGVYPYLATVANGGKVQSATGLDIFFTSDAAGSNRLPFEKVAYNAVTGAVEFFVQIPTLFGHLGTNTDTVIYLWYGQNNTANISNRNGTWAAEYVGVYHFGDGTTLDLTDSTSNANNGTNHGVTAVAGLMPDNTGNSIGGAINAVRASTQFVNCGAGASFQFTSQLVIQGVVKGASNISGTNTRCIAGNLNSSNHGYGLVQVAGTNEGGLSTNSATGNDFTQAGAAIGLGDVQMFIAIWNPTDGTTSMQISAFKQSTAVTSRGTGSGTAGHLAAGTNFEIAGSAATSIWDYFDGQIDEIRVLNSAADYVFNGTINGYPRVTVEINNWFQNVSFPFYHLGAEVPIAALAGQCNNPPAGQVGVVYPGVTFTGTGGAPPYTFAVTAGTFPPGLSLASNGVVSGTPTTAGTYNFTITITDNNSATATFNCSIVINPAGPHQIKTLRFETTKKRWFPHSYADTIVTHYLDELFPGNVDNQQLLMLSSTLGFIYKSGGNQDNGTDIDSWAQTPSMDGGDPRIQKLYVDTMSDADGTGNIIAQALFNNTTVNGPFVTFTFAGTRTQQLLNISSLTSLSLYRNIAMQYHWTGGPAGPRLYISEVAGYAQPYISTFFVTQFINLAFPGWKHHRRLYAGYLSNSALLFTIKTQDGRTFGPYTLPSTGGQFQIVEMMLDQNIKDLAFAYQIDGQGQNYALFPEAFTIEIKEWTEPSYINLAIFKT